MTTDHDHTLSGAYAVDALDADERARFEAHLSHCPDCRAEVDSLREAAALLGLGDEVAPPPALRDDVLAGIDRIRPLPPLTREPATVTPLFRRLPTLLTAAAAVVLLLGVGLAVLRPWSDDPGAQPPTAADRILAAADATHVEKSFPDGSQATIVLSRSQGKALIRTKDMAPAPDGKVYELWLQTPAGKMVRAGLMPDEPDTTYILDGDAAEATGVGITVEPDGGSEQPTTQPIAVFPLES
ncbi:anti-sigma factor [Pimelobacter simplex]|uniref:anti-sigma factor n=1 Tax=Nocardioides simplex TaxID=2045 RepID=UPI0021503F11|nr:anti-sigma factor [Pimelobacter simplex]UUW90747.1 anti-sigma factor [Pimelobacter simplex]UUW94576.1 anti-sigma factor [Pimelobacter simplex]